MKEILKALIAARREFLPLGHSGKNQSTRNEYATIEDCWASCQAALVRHDLMLRFDTLMTTPLDDVATKSGGLQHGYSVRVSAILTHVSGESISVGADATSYDVGDKALQKAQSAAGRIAMINLLALEMRAPWPSAEAVDRMIRELGEACKVIAEIEKLDPGEVLSREAEGVPELKIFREIKKGPGGDRGEILRVLNTTHRRLVR